MLYDVNAVSLEEPIALVIVNRSRGRVKGFAIDLKNAPLAIAANKKIGFPIPASLGRAQSSQTVWHKEYASIVQRLGNSDLALRAKT